MSTHQLRSALTTAAGAALAGTPVLLRRMRAEFDTRGGLTRPTAAWMYATYTAHGALYLHTLTRPDRPRPRAPLTAAALVSAVLGAGLCAAGMSRFTGPAQVTGTDQGRFTTDGVYRYSRNPQYTGYLLSLTGLALARGSSAGLALTAATAAVFRWWVPVEEHHLTRTHGPAYRHYQAATPRWLGLR